MKNIFDNKCFFTDGFRYVFFGFCIYLVKKNCRKNFGKTAEIQSRMLHLGVMFVIFV